LSPFLSLFHQRKNQNQSLYLLQVSANNKKFIPPNHHKQILPINALNIYKISQPNQPNNKQNQINLATSNQEILYGHFWNGRSGIVVGGHCRSRRSITVEGGRRGCKGWSSPIWCSGWMEVANGGGV
jgi:hypothetical protein